MLRSFQKCSSYIPPSSFFIALHLLPPPFLSHPHLFTDFIQYWWWHHMACGWITGAVSRDTCSDQNVYVWERPLLQTGGRDWTRNRLQDVCMIFHVTTKQLVVSAGWGLGTRLVQLSVTVCKQWVGAWGQGHSTLVSRNF